MDTFTVIEIKEDILSRNNEKANTLKEELLSKGILYINVMASPGSGKTSLLTCLIEKLKKSWRIGVIEADIDGAEDAKTIAEKTGVKTLQMHTGGACHITWQMSSEALEALGTEGLDLIFLENVGNLVCPAEFDTGAALNLVLLSVPEGDDKPKKYPLMFETADIVAVTKADTLPFFEDFSLDRAIENVHARKKHVRILETSSVTGAGVNELATLIGNILKQIRENHA